MYRAPTVGTMNDQTQTQDLFETNPAVTTWRGRGT